jgi:hypothetical protein
MRAKTAMEARKRSGRHRLFVEELFVGQPSGISVIDTNIALRPVQA